MNDTTLQLDVENFRAVSKASICVDEITVLAGVNACGKSTLAHLFHSLINLNAIYPTSLETYFWDELSWTVGATEELKWQIEHLGESRSMSDRHSGRIFQPQLHVKPFTTLLSDFDTFQETALDLCQTKFSVDDVRRAYSAFVRELRMDFKSAFDESKQPSPEEVKHLISQKVKETVAAYNKAKSNRDYNAFLRGDYLSRAMLLERGKISLSEGASTVYATNRGLNEDSASVMAPLKPLYGVSRAVYVESPWRSMPTVKEGEILDSLDGFPAMQRKGGVFDKTLFSILSGRIDSVENQTDALTSLLAPASPKVLSPTFRWMYTREDGRQFGLESCATGIRSLAILNAYYQWGILDSKTLLIIDEPEAHLHPQWIVEYAKILVRLVKELKVRLLITTHSPYMVRALRNVSDAELSQSKIAFYLAEQDKDYQFAYRSTGTDIAPIFKVFNIALDEIACYQEV